MFDFQDLFQWDRFITPTIIKTFYWLVIGLIVLFGISGIFSGLAAMAISPFGGFILLLSSIAGVVVGVVFSRIAAEFILIVFRINEHLGAIRDQGADALVVVSPDRECSAAVLAEPDRSCNGPAARMRIASRCAASADAASLTY